MKYNWIFLSILFLSLSYGNTESSTPAQSVLEYCTLNPNHKRSKLIRDIFDELKPRYTVTRIWRVISGKAMFLPSDFMRHYFLMSCQEIGKELGWDEKKIYREFDQLCNEANRIRNS